MFKNYSCHWLQPVVDDEFLGAEFIRRLFVRANPQGFRRLKSALMFFVINYGLKPVAWIVCGCVINCGLKPIAWIVFGCVINYGLKSVAWFVFCCVINYRLKPTAGFVSLDWLTQKPVARTGKLGG